jgi:hypothetical protein
MFHTCRLPSHVTASRNLLGESDASKREILPVSSKAGSSRRPARLYMYRTPSAQPTALKSSLPATATACACIRFKYVYVREQFITRPHGQLPLWPVTCVHTHMFGFVCVHSVQLWHSGLPKIAVIQFSMLMMPLSIFVGK